MQVVYPTTPAQHFHALRRQMKNDPRKPLIVMTPKSLLRHPQATSTDRRADQRPLRAGAASTPRPIPRPRQRIVLTSGKVYYDLRTARDKANANIPLIRLEQFYPFPQPMLADAIAAASRTRRRSSGSRTSRATWAPGRSSTSAWRRCTGESDAALRRPPDQRVTGDGIASPARGAAAGAGQAAVE